jgi:glycine betaine/proline transport system ATP-binding protein
VSEHNEEGVVVTRNVWKIFGDRANEAMDAVRRDNLTKAEVLEQFGAVVGVKDVSISVGEGEVFCIMGLSGSGKSTLVRHINRLIEPTGGEILINGVDVNGLNPEELRLLRADKIGMVFQNMALLPHRTVRDNVALSLELRNIDAYTRAQVADQVIELVSLQGYGDRKPSELSGGMQQRVGIARALTANTDIMLMDEAFSALDPLIRSDMQNLLLALQKELQKTIIFITHDLDEALKLADHLVILKDGAVVQQGEPQHILLDPQDPYIEDFVSDINRARVLRIRSIMEPVDRDSFDGDVGADSTLEALIAQSDGDISRVYRVMQNDAVVGQVNMKMLVKALVPRLRNHS